MLSRPNITHTRLEAFHRPLTGLGSLTSLLRRLHWSWKEKRAAHALLFSYLMAMRLHLCDTYLETSPPLATCTEKSTSYHTHPAIRFSNSTRQTPRPAGVQNHSWHCHFHRIHLWASPAACNADCTGSGVLACFSLHHTHGRACKLSSFIHSTIN